MCYFFVELLCRISSFFHLPSFLQIFVGLRLYDRAQRMELFFLLPTVTHIASIPGGWMLLGCGRTAWSWIGNLYRDSSRNKCTVLDWGWWRLYSNCGDGYFLFMVVVLLVCLILFRMFDMQDFLLWTFKFLSGLVFY